MPQKSLSQSNVMTGAAQTMAAWSRVIDSYEEMPAIYRDWFEQFIGSPKSFPWVVLTPALNKFPRKTTEKLICDTDDVLLIFERTGHQVSVTSHPYSQVCEVEMGIILLDSWLTLSGKTDRGEHCISKIEFNTTSLRYFEPIIDKLRPSPLIVDKTQFAREKDKFDHLSTTNFKFMNYGRESLVPGETVLQILMQREIFQPIFNLFGRIFYKTVSFPHLSIITDRELILIYDAQASRKSQPSRYGSVWQYLPLHCIESVQISEAANPCLMLSIHSHSGKTIEKLFEATKRSELEQFCSKLQTLI